MNAKIQKMDTVVEVHPKAAIRQILVHGHIGVMELEVPTASSANFGFPDSKSCLPASIEYVSQDGNMQ